MSRPHGRVPRRALRLLRPELELVEPRQLLATITVTSIGDEIAHDGLVTLREAITAANTNAPSGDAPAGETLPAIDRIEFNIPGEGVHTVRPLTPLPAVVETVVIDGYSQPGASPNTVPLATQGTNAVLHIELDGSLIPGDQWGSPVGVNLHAPDSVVRGLVVNRFGGLGIALFPNGGDNEHGPGCRAEGNFVGTDPTGRLALPNQFGIAVGGFHNTVGGLNPEARNVISGNREGGVYIGGVNGADGTHVQGNVIGVGADARTPIPNGDARWDSAAGVTTTNDWGAMIGGIEPGAANLIAFNFGRGVQGPNVVIGNSIRDNREAGIVPYRDYGFTITLQSAWAVAAGTTVRGNLIGNAGEVVRIEIFANAPTDSPGMVQGARHVASIGAVVGGEPTIEFTVVGEIDRGDVLTATITPRDGLTSSFSNAVPITDPPPPPVEPPPPPDDTTAPTLVAFNRRGLAFRPTQFILAFSEELDPASAATLSNYRLVGTGPDGRLGTADDRRINLKPVVYDPAARTVTLTPKRRLPLALRFRLTARNVVDRSGNALDGDGDGQPGGDLVRRIDRRTLARPARRVR